MLEKLLGLATIGSTFASISLLHRFLSRLAILIALIIVTSIMTGVLLAGIFYGIYEGLTYYGLTHDAALLLVAALVLILTASLFGLTLSRIRQLREIAPSPVNQTFPSLGHIAAVAEAFVDGFLTRQPHPHGKKDKD